jgi:nondiscriminating aspartyl-tRNA synthetase
MGGVAFALLRDRAGLLQLTLKRGVSPPEHFDLLASLSRESVVEAEGTTVESPRARVGAEVIPDVLRVLARAEAPLPLGVADKVGADLDTRLNHRVLDLRKPEVRQIFRLRSALLEGFRSAFRQMGFWEVETPKILRQGAEGGATLFRVDYFGGVAYLAQSPQLYKQMLMAADFERVFEIAPAFRAEPSDTSRHLTEFTSLDAEMAYIEGPEELWTTVEGLIQRAFTLAREALETAGEPLATALPEVRTPFPRIPFREAVRLLGRSPQPPERDADLGAEDERKLGELIPRQHGNDFYFLTGFPTSVKKGTFYAMRRDEEPSLTQYFDLDYRGWEIVSGGQREHRPDRLEAQIREAGLDPAQFPSYLEAFRYGMPPHGGFALGIDRLTALLTGVPNVREARLFPRDRYRLEP